MDTLLFEPDVYERLYNCSWYSVDAVPMEERRSPWLGSAYFGLALAAAVIYLPCAVVIGRHMQYNCYKMMFVLAWWDIAALVNTGLFVGYFGVRGIVFCSSPLLVYLNGCLAMMFWVGESSLAVMLALNRCVELLTPKLVPFLFDGWRTWAWIAAALCYAVVAGIMSQAFAFSSIYFSYFYHPHVGYYAHWQTDQSYRNEVQPIHNMIILFALILLYTILVVGLMWKHSRSAAGGGSNAPIVNDMENHAGGKVQENSERGKWQSKILLQVVVISTANALTATLFVYFQFFPVPVWLIYASTYFYMSTHGLPGVVYLMWNPTIRSDCKKLILRCLGKPQMQSSTRIAAITVGATRRAAGGGSPSPKTLGQFPHFGTARTSD